MRGVGCGLGKTGVVQGDHFQSHHPKEEEYWIRGRLDCGQLRLEVMAADLDRNIAVDICPLKPFPTFCRTPV